MLDREFFATGLHKHASDKARSSLDGAVTVRMQLSSGEILSVLKLIAAEDGYVVIEIYPLQGGVRKSPSAEKAMGSPQFDLDRLAIPYHTILSVEITTRRVAKQEIGFQL